LSAPFGHHGAAPTRVHPDCGASNASARKFRKARILSSNPYVGVNRGAFLRPTREKNGAEGRRKPCRATHRDSPRRRTSNGRGPQLVGCVEERTRGSCRYTEGAEVNYRGRQIRVKMVWLPKRNPVPNAKWRIQQPRYRENGLRHGSVFKDRYSASSILYGRGI